MKRWRIAIARFGLLAIMLAGFRASAFGAACTSTGSGNWTSNIWSCGGNPGTNDAVTIAAGNTITLNVSTTVTSITFTGGATVNKLVQISTASLSVKTDVTINQPTNNAVTNGWYINSATAS